MIESALRDRGITNANVIAGDEDRAFGDMEFGLAVSGASGELQIEVMPVVATARPCKPHDWLGVQVLRFRGNDRDRCIQRFAFAIAGINGDRNMFAENKKTSLKCQALFGSIGDWRRNRHFSPKIAS